MDNEHCIMDDVPLMYMASLTILAPTLSHKMMLEYSMNNWIGHN